MMILVLIVLVPLAKEAVVVEKKEDLQSCPHTTWKNTIVQSLSQIICM